MQEKKKACSLIGTAPEEFLWDYNQKDLIEKRHYDVDRFTELEKRIWEGYEYFICGCERGADMDFAEDILYFRVKAYPNIQLEIVLRYPEQAEEYDEKEKRRYQNILSKADKVTVVGEKQSRDSAKKKRRYLAENAEKALIVWNFKNKGEAYKTFAYVKRQKIGFEFLSLPLCLKEHRERIAMLLRYAQRHLNM